MNTLIYCLNVLKIKEDSEVYRNAVKLAENAPIESNEWISAMRTIASVSEDYIFSKSQLSDFLTLAAKGIEHTKTSCEQYCASLYKRYSYTRLQRMHLL